MAKVNFKKIDFSKILIASFLVIALVVQFAFLSYLFKALLPDDKKAEENIVMTYTSNGSFDYKVYMQKNDFIKEEYLKPGEAYILNLIDHINVSDSYKFTSTSKTKVTGNTKVVAKLKGYYRETGNKNGNSEILKKDVLISERKIDFNDTNYSNSGSFDIYLDDYINTLNEFQRQVKITVDGYLEITSETTFDGKIGGAKYNDAYTATMKIPLSSSVIRIDATTNNPKNKTIYEGELIKTNKTVLWFVIGANVVTFLIICLLLRKLFMFTNKSEYEKELEKLLKNYDDIIVNTTTVLDVDRYKLIEINEFKEILNLSRELLLPIMNYEFIKGKETWFYVVKDDILYRYIISSSKLEKQKQIKKKEVSE